MRVYLKLVVDENVYNAKAKNNNNRKKIIKRKKILNESQFYLSQIKAKYRKNRKKTVERIVLIFVIYFLQKLSPPCRVVLKLSETAKI